MEFQAEYSVFENYIKDIILKNDFSNFKSHRHFTYMLEHVTEPQGREYLNLLLKILSIDEINVFCDMNDSIGNPKIHKYGAVKCSTTSLRYLYHAYLCLKHLETAGLKDIVEIGGGYGGLCLAINFLCKKLKIDINSYTLIDLPYVAQLQRIYLSNFDILFEYNSIDSTLFGEDLNKSNLFLISNYSFSEILPEFQKKYIQKLFPKVSHGFITWNHVPVFNFGYECVIEPEKPLTTDINKFVKF